MTQTLTTEQVQEIYEAAVHVEATLGDPDAELDLYCKLDDVGGVEATIRKLIDMLRAANREAQPVYQCRFFTTDVDGKQIGEWQDMDKGFYDQYDPYCRRILYTAPSAPAVPDESDPRDAFESVFPMPKYVVRCGAGYAVTAYSAWGANDFVERWEGWNACCAAMVKGAK